MNEPTVYFRRRQFYGDHNTRSPRWHVHEGPQSSDRGTFKALCGYTFGNAHGQLLVSRTEPPTPRGDMCGKCARKLDPATPVT